jgi:protein involved in polysaccharide export with SLBB domain
MKTNGVVETGLFPTRLSASAGVILCALLVWLCTGCATSRSPSSTPETAVPPASNLLREGDVLHVAFPGATNLNTALKIPLDGVIQLPFVGPIPAAGKTTAELQGSILERYGSQLQLKEVNITIVSTSATIYVSGAVLKPGRIPLERPLTVLEAVMEAGGFDPNRAKLGDVVVIRYVDGLQQTFRVDLRRTLSGKLTKAFYLKPFDVVHVPSKTFNL